MPGELQIPMWEWWIVLYFFAGGIAGGAYFTSAILELVDRPEYRPIARMGYYIAFPLSLVCAVALIADLGRPERFWHMIVYSKTFLPWPKWDSPISVGAYAVLFFGLFSFVSFVDALVETGRLPGAPFREKYSRFPRLIYSLLGAFFGFFLASYTGVLLATTHLPMWSTHPVLGALFLASGASTGIAAIMWGLALTRANVGEGLARLKQADAAAIIFEIVLLVVFVVLLFMNGAAPSLWAILLLIGGTLVIGLIAPLLIEFRAGKATASSTIGVAALVLLGGFIMRTVVVMGGQGLM
jgi:formate-dependent nitrite reductase membrane component NrfD